MRFAVFFFGSWVWTVSVSDSWVGITRWFLGGLVSTRC